eukprot:247965-Pelagomonas_calceolata.AAC.7
MLHTKWPGRHLFDRPEMKSTVCFKTRVQMQSLLGRQTAGHGRAYRTWQSKEYGTGSRIIGKRLQNKSSQMQTTVVC